MADSSVLNTLPELIFKVCPRCRRIKPGTQSLCAECQDAEKLRKRRARDYAREYRKRMETEDPVYRKFYRSKAWRMTSQRYAQKKGYHCEECGGVGTDVHHIQPIQTPAGWARRLDLTNLKLLCVGCHNKAHGRVFGGGARNGGSA